MQNPTGNQYPGKIFKLLNCVALIMSVLIVFLSTHIRLGEAGLGCQPWPECYAQLSFADSVKGLQIPDTTFKPFRAMHRQVAGILGIVILIIALMAIRYRKQISPLLPILMLLVVVFLSLLGIATPTRSLPLVTLGNILGGIVLAGLIWRQLLTIQGRKSVPGPRILLLLSLMVTLQLISGAWASANYTGSACPQIASCTYTENLAANVVQSANIFRRLNLDAHSRLVLDESASIIQFSHRLMAVFLFVVVLAGLLTVKRSHPALLKPMLIVTVVFFAEFLLGVFNVLTEMPLWTNTLHNLLAVGLLFATINLTTQVHFHKKLMVE